MYKSSKVSEQIIELRHGPHEHRMTFAHPDRLKKEIWNPKIAERKRPAFKTGKELLTFNRWNYLAQTPTCDLEKNWFFSQVSL